MQPELYFHQKEALNVAYDKTAFAWFMEMGTGKSAIIIHEISHLIEREEINCAIILAPNNVHVNWKSEFFIHCPNIEKIGIQIWRSGQDKEKREAETKAILNSGKTLVFLMNIEAISTTTGREYLKRILSARRKAYLAIDESHKIKNPTAIRTKSAIELSKFAKIRRIATGTEAEEGIENLFSQFKFLDPNIIGTRSYTAFKAMFCVMGGFENREIKGYRNETILAKNIAPHIYSKRKKDCLDLPDKVYVRHEISPTMEQFKLYRQLEEELIIELKNGTIVDATMAVTRIIRLQQILCGHLNSSERIQSDGKTQYLLSRQHVETIPSNRASYVAEIVDEASSKVIVFCRFIKDVELVVLALANAGIGSIGISSLVDGNNRMAEIDRWRKEPHLKALVMTTATGGIGLTLNEATTTIFYSNSWSATDRIQAEDRNHRIGQNDKVTYHDMVVPNTVDDKLLRALLNKQKDSIAFRNLTDVVRFLEE